VEAGQAPLVLRDELRLKGREPVARNGQGQRASWGHDGLGIGAVAVVSRFYRLIACSPGFYVQMVRQLSGQHAFGQLFLELSGQARLTQHALRVLALQLREQLIDQFVWQWTLGFTLARGFLRVGHWWLLSPCYDLRTQKSG